MSDWFQWLGNESVKAARDWLGAALGVIAFLALLWDRLIAPLLPLWRIGSIILFATIIAVAVVQAIRIIGEARERNGLYEALLPSLWAAYMFMEPDPHSEDSWHFYNEHTWQFEIKGRDGIYTADIRGTNVHTKPTEFFPHKVSGDTTILFGDLEAYYIDKKTGQRYSVENKDIIYDRDYIKCFRVEFPTPLSRGDTFEIQVVCKWPATFSRKDDFVFMAFQRFKQGVGKATARIVLPAPPRAFRAAIWERGKPPGLVTGEEGVRLRRDGSTIIWEKDTPRQDCIYLIRFRREDLPGTAVPSVWNQSSKANPCHISPAVKNNPGHVTDFSSEGKLPGKLS